MSKPKKYASMTKDKLMTYTFIALLVLTAISYLSFGFDALIVALISVGVAVAIDLLLHKVAADSPLNIMSAAVFGLIVALSYSFGLPTMGVGGTYALNATMQGTGLYIFPALISMIGMVLFKKILSLKGRKVVNPAAAAKLLVLVFMLSVALLPAEHTDMFPSLTSSLSLNPANAEDITTLPSFGLALQQCFGNDYSAYAPDFTRFNTIGLNDVLYTMVVLKYHGWAGGISSIAVIAIGLALFAICRRYIKWRITVAYLATVALFALALSFVYADGDPILRIVFHLFAGSSIFMAFFMATDPASTPLTYKGQMIFGAGLGLLTVGMQTYLNFFGGAIFALIIMNLTSPLLDRVGRMRPSTEKKEPKLPKAKQFTAVKTYECIRCGACMRACCHKLSPILIKEAFDKQDVEKLMKLKAEYCTGCGDCSFVCPSRIDLKGSSLRAKAMFRPEPTPEPKPQSVATKAKKAIDRGVEIIKIEGIGPVYAEKLNSMDINTTTDLLEAGATPLGRKELAEKTGVSDKLILEWVNIADLFRIEGVGEEYSDLLEESGVDTVVELSKRVPENLHAKMLEVNEKKKLVKRPPTLNEVKQWIEEAKKLPRKIGY